MTRAVIIASGLLAMAAAPSQPARLAGFYQAHHMEVGGAIELSRNGRFRYQLDYGAVSEGAAGKWSTDGQSVILTSEPMPIAPAFVIVRDDPLPLGKLAVAVIDSGSPYFDDLEVAISLDGAPGEMARIGKDQTLDLPPESRISITPMVPITGQAGAPIALDPARGHALKLHFLPNDIDKARFDHQKLAIDHGGLLLNRYDVTIRFDKTKP